MSQPDPTVLLEIAIARKLSELSVRVKRFADEFRKTGTPQQSLSVLVGHSTSEYQWSIEVPEPVGVELASYEIRVEAADVHNHSKALEFLTAAMNVLRGFEPYEGIKPIIPIRYAPAGYNTTSGTWTYTGIVRAAISRPRSEYTLIESLPDVEVVSLGIYREGYLQRQIDINVEVS